MELYALLALSGLTLLCSLLSLVFSLRGRRADGTQAELAHLKSELREELRALRQENAQTVQSSVRAMGDLLRDAQQNGADAQQARLSELAKQNELMLRSMAGGFSAVDDLDAAVDEMDEVCRLPGLSVKGIFTHFAAADGAGTLRCYEKAGGTLLWTYQKPAADGASGGLTP